MKQQLRTSAGFMETTSSPTDPIFEPDDAESRSELNQRLTAYGATVGAIALAMQHIFIEVHLHGWPSMTLTVTSLLGWAALGIGVARNRKLGKTPEGKAFFEQARKDERLIAMRAQAFTFGFAFMLGVQVVLLVLWTLFGHIDSGVLSIPIAASSTIAAGVTGAVLRYQTLASR